ncbi:hypothetical protein E4P41_15145 [Geodermatophilus sp. DF01-2]|uniref:hypothetical protein n=1 Tax=Geodermatophilus sp. DF01-2 TaxID=2559610 RepID=UPI001072FE00|nr:hypothetical protein [Geodermatophilus sp. DF01_2]TFV56879.1 hypothetical protein E4P41_15145 [Geodermatophilus sp. DF01_2]
MGWESFVPLRPVRRRPRPERWPFLRTARLNAVGRSALGGACLVAAAASAPALRRSGWPWPLRAAPGPAAVLAGLVLADRRKWAGMESGFTFTDDPMELRTVADRLAAQDLPVRLQEQPPTLRYAHRDARRVHAALEELGIRPPTW